MIVVCPCGGSIQSDKRDTIIRVIGDEASRRLKALMSFGLTIDGKSDSLNRHLVLAHHRVGIDVRQVSIQATCDGREVGRLHADDVLLTSL